MAVAPFIKPISTNKGIFYSFQSAIEDTNMTFNNGVNKFRFSKFAMIRFPVIGTPNTLKTDNNVQFLAVGEVPIEQGLDQDNNINLAQSFQNYALNLETLLISMKSYTPDQKLKVSERVFWKWMKEMGAVRWRTANTLEQDTSVVTNRNLFVEEDETNSTYNRVVKYIGDIDVVNSVRSIDNSYSELYLYVPTNVGTTPYVLFDSKSDGNYFPGQVITNTPDDPLDDAYLAGRHYTDVHPFGLSTLAYYDLLNGAVTTRISNAIDPTTLAPGNWFTGTILDSYYTDSILNGTNEVYNVPTNQLIEKTYSSRSVQYVRNKLDGVTIDFALGDYKLANENPAIKTFSEFGDYVQNKNFEYNAVLVYYDVYDPNNVDEQGNYLDAVTNLYGILFLDKVETDGLKFAIPFIDKYKPDPIAKTNGNAFAFKLNLKFDNTVEDSAVEKSINDFNTFSLDLFLDVLTQFKSIQTSMNDKIVELENLKQELQLAKDALLNTTTEATIDARLTTLEDSFAANTALFQNTNSVMQMINKLSDQFNDLVEGTSSIAVSYNTDAIRPGPGISAVKKSGKLTISNINQGYNTSLNGSVFNLNDVINTGKKLKLVPFTNYNRHENGTLITVLNANLNLYIDDTIGWSTGQTLDLVFADPVNMGTFDIKIYTDANNVLLASAPYSKLITILDGTQFTDNLAAFRIICLDAPTLTFRVDRMQ